MQGYQSLGGGKGPRAPRRCLLHGQGQGDVAPPRLLSHWQQQQQQWNKRVSSPCVHGVRSRHTDLRSHTAGACHCHSVIRRLKALPVCVKAASARLDVLPRPPLSLNRHFCCAVLCCAVLCCAVLCCAVLCAGIGSVRSGLHPVQAALASSHGSQCGFCTPGFVMSMYALLRNLAAEGRGPPTEHDIEECLAGNLW
jgi:hypothetical protein